MKFRNFRHLNKLWLTSQNFSHFPDDFFFFKTTEKIWTKVIGKVLCTTAQLHKCFSCKVFNERKIETRKAAKESWKSFITWLWKTIFFVREFLRKSRKKSRVKMKRKVSKTKKFTRVTFLFNTKEINLHHATSQIDLKSEQIFYLISNDDDMEELRVFIT